MRAGSIESVEVAVSADLSRLVFGRLLLLLGCLAPLLFFMLDDPVQVAEHVRVCCLETEVLLDFNLNVIKHKG